MTYERIDLGPVPCDETAASVGAADYVERSLRECQAFKRMLLRLNPIPDGVDAELSVKAYAHDFGTYREVTVKYASENQASCNYAFSLEDSTPTNWDALARYELLWLEKRDQVLLALRRGEIAEHNDNADFRFNRMPSVGANLSFMEMLQAHPI